jgi:hypothetical protein
MSFESLEQRARLTVINQGCHFKTGLRTELLKYPQKALNAIFWVYLCQLSGNLDKFNFFQASFLRINSIK